MEVMQIVNRIRRLCRRRRPATLVAGAMGGVAHLEGICNEFVLCVADADGKQRERESSIEDFSVDDTITLFTIQS